ncbi:DNA/RNA non-specific endonuclease [Candidatus Magnetaquicoccus inordinatus]|uniref:DNA/RNA non-specific endonuclease n=1 Tax=Candidatus Magnetaquicoccus inordinatus TaxID=2496818 RepID=UPI001D0DC260|nr:DNA/RNA non-specific endonuclease [Candidatus Magnetaquicoccus inordinatus]
MKRLAVVVSVWAVIFAVNTVQASKTDCPEQFAGGAAPDITNPKVGAKAVPLCFREFAVLHSGVTRTPLWSAEHLTKVHIKEAKNQERINLFHEEERLPVGERATLEDYKKSGFDRGHMAPSADMPDEQSQAESFSLANMVPQAPENNRGLWAHIEKSVRKLTQSEGEVFVVTGPVFQGASIKRLNGRVFVPTALFKAVYVPKRQAAGVYLANNAPGDDWRTISLSELRQLTGLDVFPSLPQAVKDQAMKLPDPDSKSHKKDK